MGKIEYSEKKLRIDGVTFSHYNNGNFVVMFQEAAKGLAKSGLTKTECWILLYLIGEMRDKSIVYVNYAILAEELGCSKRSVKDSIDRLVQRNILIRRFSQLKPRVDECTLNLLNHRLAFKGSLKNNDFTPHLMPPLLKLDGRNMLSLKDGNGLDSVDLSEWE